MLRFRFASRAHLCARRPRMRCRSLHYFYWLQEDVNFMRAKRCERSPFIAYSRQCLITLRAAITGSRPCLLPLHISYILQYRRYQAIFGLYLRLYLIMPDMPR